MRAPVVEPVCRASAGMCTPQARGEQYAFQSRNTLGGLSGSENATFGSFEIFAMTERVFCVAMMCCRNVSVVLRGVAKAHEVLLVLWLLRAFRNSETRSHVAIWKYRMEELLFIYCGGRAQGIFNH